MTSRVMADEPSVGSAIAASMTPTRCRSTEPVTASFQACRPTCRTISKDGSRPRNVSAPRFNPDGSNANPSTKQPRVE